MTEFHIIVHRILVAVTFSLILVEPSHAFTGLQLYSACSHELGNDGDRLCQTYIRGFIDGLIIGTVAPTRYCPPKEGVDAVQARLIVEKYLRDHPEQLNQEAAALAARAMTDAFGCPPAN